MKSTATPVRERTAKPAALVPQPVPANTAGQPEPRFRTVLVEGCGWPTEASVPAPRKRAARR